MAIDDYKRALQKARKDLEVAQQEKAVLDSRIAALKQTIAGLIPLSGEVMDSGEDLVDEVIEAAEGISNGIRRVLSKSSAPMSAPEIRNALAKKTEFKEKLESYASPLTVIYNTLKRLERQKEVTETESGWALKQEK